jgi:hypothetical protein
MATPIAIATPIAEVAVIIEDRRRHHYLLLVFIAQRGSFLAINQAMHNNTK